MVSVKAWSTNIKHWLMIAPYLICNESNFLYSHQWSVDIFSKKIESFIWHSSLSKVKLIARVNITHSLAFIGFADFALLQSRTDNLVIRRNCILIYLVHDAYFSGAQLWYSTFLNELLPDCETSTGAKCKKGNIVSRCDALGAPQWMHWVGNLLGTSVQTVAYYRFSRHSETAVNQRYLKMRGHCANRFFFTFDLDTKEKIIYIPGFFIPRELL